MPRQAIDEDLVRAALRLHKLHPKWSYTRIGKIISDDIGRYPPYQGDTIGKHIRRLKKVGYDA